jgi:hypothetical protein
MILSFRKEGFMSSGLLKAFIVLMLLLGIFAFFQLRYSTALASKFDGVIPFSTASGLIGFFNQNDGKIYVYDGNLQNCILVSQILELGRPIVKIIGKQP